MPDLVLSAGMIRSGSTWLYNAARLIMCIGETNRAGWIDDLDKSQLTDYSLVKLHRPNVRLANASSKVVTCHRDIRDVVVSLAGMGWAKTEDDMLAFARLACRDHTFWSARASVDLRYENIIAAPEACLRQISLAIKGCYDNKLLSRVIEELHALPNHFRQQEYNSRTLMHFGHRQNGQPGRWRYQLDTSIAKTIFLEHRDWFQSHGYQQF